MDVQVHVWLVPMERSVYEECAQNKGKEGNTVLSLWRQRDELRSLGFVNCRVQDM